MAVPRRKFKEATKRCIYEMAECSGKSCTLIKKLLDSESLKCQSCKKLLQLPVWLVNGVGNVCNSCTLENNWEGTQVEVYNVLLKELIIPCTNVNVGCSEEIQYEHLEEHLKICKYRPVKCPHEECTWLERQDNLSSHFKESHNEDVIKSDRFNFDLNIQTSSLHFTKLLIKMHLEFLFVLNQDNEADELTCTLFKFHKDAPCSTTIKFCNTQGKEWSFKIDLNLLDSTVQEYSAEKIKLTVLRSIFHDDPLSLVVNVPPNDDLLNSLECPICNDTMRPPIYQCMKGHTICGICVEKVDTCPSCTAVITQEIRNFSLESLTSKMFYVCCYKSGGCTAVLSGDEVMSHESNCFYHLSRCPLQNCNFQYNAKNILPHLRVEHEYSTNEFQFLFPAHGIYGLSDRNWSKFMYVDGCFFLARYFYGTYPPKCSPPRGHSLEHIYLQFQKLNCCNKQVKKNVYCKVKMENEETQAEVTHIQFLNHAEKSGFVNKYYKVFIPVEAFFDAVNVCDKAIVRFTCNLLMK